MKKINMKTKKNNTTNKDLLNGFEIIKTASKEKLEKIEAFKKIKIQNS